MSVVVSSAKPFTIHSLPKSRKAKAPSIRNWACVKPLTGIPSLVTNVRVRQAQGNPTRECAVAEPRDLWAHLSVVRGPSRNGMPARRRRLPTSTLRRRDVKGGGGPDKLGLPASNGARPRTCSSMPGPDRLDPGIPVDGDRPVSSARWDNGQPHCVARVRPECHSVARPSIPAHSNQTRAQIRSVPAPDSSPDARFRGTLASQPGHLCEPTEVPNRAVCDGTPSHLRKYPYFLRPST